MADKLSWVTYEKLISAPYWEPQYAGLFDSECALEYPFAPPGMPQYFSAIERPIHFDWLARTTKNWEFTEIESYGAPEDGDIFWLIRKGTCLAGWAGLKDQHFTSRYIMKITIRDGKITHLKELFDPLAFLRAAGKKLPVFPMVIDPEAAAREQIALDEKKTVVFECTDSPEVCEARKQRSLDALRYHRIDPAYADAMPCHPKMDGVLWFAPPAMDENCTPHRQAGHLDWLAKCEVDSNYSSNVFPVYATADPNVYFDETCYHGIMHWVGAEHHGHYRNTYFDRIVFDHGYMIEFSEALNPINKFNSINVELPTFPYYFD